MQRSSSRFPARERADPVSLGGAARAYARTHGGLQLELHGALNPKGPSCPNVTPSHEIDVPEVLGPALSVRCDGEDRTKASSQIGTVWSVDCRGADVADHELTVDVTPP